MLILGVMHKQDCSLGACAAGLRDVLPRLHGQKFAFLGLKTKKEGLSDL